MACLNDFTWNFILKPLLYILCCCENGSCCCGGENQEDLPARSKQRNRARDGEIAHPRNPALQRPRAQQRPFRNAQGIEMIPDRQRGVGVARGGAGNARLGDGRLLGRPLGMGGGFGGHGGRPRGGMADQERALHDRVRVGDGAGLRPVRAAQARGRRRHFPAGAEVGGAFMAHDIPDRHEEAQLGEEFGEDEHGRDVVDAQPGREPPMVLEQHMESEEWEGEGDIGNLDIADVVGHDRADARDGPVDTTLGARKN
ncbi:hypothetical protein FKW77_010221 [Venturia effusa]|uniref:Uncharacterized protein n=1 Tax=Venturia effusa TaxID=50376 RepID=A0A517L8C5_9PEZI|nr:hypothetical protein FKW77_010221 [Venturia effusa]